MWIVNKTEANDALRYALNELRAFDAGENIDSDRRTLPGRLRALADYLEIPDNTPPDAESIIREAASIPIQR